MNKEERTIYIGFFMQAGLLNKKKKQMDKQIRSDTKICTVKIAMSQERERSVKVRCKK